jgi:mRNA interferase RelE/StbE
MSYKIVFRRIAQKELDEIQNPYAIKIVLAINNLSEDPRPAGCKKLKVPDTALWRIRIGDYRVIYSIEDVVKIIEVIRVGHRGDVYQNL